MNLFKNLLKQNPIKEEIEELFISAEYELELATQKINTIKINEKGLAEHTEIPVEGSEFLITKYLNNIKSSLLAFRTCYFNFIKYVNKLSTYKLNKKQTIKLECFNGYKEEVDMKILELYSRFIVTAQILPEQRDEILDIFLDIAKPLNLPIHKHNQTTHS